MQIASFILMSAVVLGSSLAPLSAGAATPLPVQPGDHLCVIGNALGERMQHDGWLEALIYARFPQANLVFRNLAFTGDELTLRLRSDNFGAPDQHLARHQADLILAFFGFNESFAGAAGLPKFKRDLDRFIHDTLQQHYNGKTGPRLVLFSPIAHENLRDPNLPDGAANNRNLELYTEAMAEAVQTQRKNLVSDGAKGEKAQENTVWFVDLFHPSLKLYGQSPTPLTINGIHLSEEGNKLLAPVIMEALFPGNPVAPMQPAALEKLRASVKDKNFYWFHRYRTVDGYNVYGGRSRERYAENISNWTVLQREMEVLDVMTANRDKRVWAVAQGKDLAVDDTNIPPLIEVKSNRPGPGPNGTYTLLDPETAVSHMKPGQGMKVNLFASEKEYPDLARPVQMAWDTQGRLWVACMQSYPHWRPTDEMNDKVLILEDTDGDGKADRCVVFAGHLSIPTGLEFY